MMVAVILKVIIWQKIREMEHIQRYPNLIELLDHNTEQVKQKLFTRLTTKPNENDEIGYLYGFTRDCDRNRSKDHHLKCGRTAKSTPDKRIAEWSGNQTFSVRTRYNRKLESVFECFFAFARVARINPATNKKEIEWYHFVDNYNVSRVVCLANEIADLVGNVFGFIEDVEENEIVEAIVPSSKPTLNINTCTQEDLQTIFMIGQAISKRIIDYRNVKPFDTLDEVKNVKGLGGDGVIFGHLKKVCYCEQNNQIPIVTPVAPERASEQSNPSFVGRDMFNINTCSKEDLMTITGLGGKDIYAQNIIDYRNKHGKFAILEDVMNVANIKTSVFGGLKMKCYCE